MSFTSIIDYTCIVQFRQKVEGQKLFTIFLVKLLFEDILQTLIFTNPTAGKLMLSND